MSHSVEKHLAVRPDEYDAEILRFVPGYAEMIEEVIAALREHVDDGRPLGNVVDLGAGTGALASRLLAGFAELRVLLLDADADMLAQAKSRLAASSERVELLHRSFAGALPPVDAAVASLSLHHVHDKGDKRAVYRNVLGALRPGGVLVSADAMVSADPVLAEQVRRRWALHLVSSGDTPERARARLAEWGLEDRYFGVDEELALLREAGFAAIDVRWRKGPVAVVVAAKAK